MNKTITADEFYLKVKNYIRKNDELMHYQYKHGLHGHFIMYDQLFNKDELVYFLKQTDHELHIKFQELLQLVVENKND